MKKPKQKRTSLQISESLINSIQEIILANSKTNLISLTIDDLEVLISESEVPHILSLLEIPEVSPKRLELLEKFTRSLSGGTDHRIRLQDNEIAILIVHHYIMTESIYSFQDYSSVERYYLAQGNIFLSKSKSVLGSEKFRFIMGSLERLHQCS